MNKDLKKQEIVRRAVFKSIILELGNKLKDKTNNEKRRAEITKFARSRLNDILKSIGQDVLLPKREVTSKQEFEKHILKVMQLVRRQFVRELEKDISDA